MDSFVRRNVGEVQGNTPVIQKLHTKGVGRSVPLADGLVIETGLFAESFKRWTQTASTAEDAISEKENTF